MGRKIKAFRCEWLNRKVEDIQVKTWCTSDPQDKQNAKCLMCPPTDKMLFGRIFNIGEGFTAVVKHFKTKTHQDAMEHEIEREALGETKSRQIDIEQAVKNG